MPVRLEDFTQGPFIWAFVIPFICIGSIAAYCLQGGVQEELTKRAETLIQADPLADARAMRESGEPIKLYSCWVGGRQILPGVRKNDPEETFPSQTMPNLPPDAPNAREVNDKLCAYAMAYNRELLEDCRAQRDARIAEREARGSR